MARLPVSPGISGIPTATIPTDPVAFVDWFKNSFLPRWAANADARNAVPTSSSVQITGDLNSPAGIGIGPNSVTNGELVMRSPLSVMGNPTAVEANVQDIIAGADNEALQRIAGALVWAPVSASVNVADSITGIGSLVSPLELVGDNASPGNTQYYGTNASGTKGFFPVQGSSITTLLQSGGASQSYPIPPNATTLFVINIGGGGGGGSGAKAASGSIANGGGGGGGGGISYATFRASDLGSSVTVTFSAGTGVGGAGITTNSTSGSVGTIGSNVNFGGRLIALGGSPGGGGVGSSGAAGNGGGGLQANGTNGGSSANTGGAIGVAQTGGVYGATSYGNTGGGGGGSVSAGLLASAGGAGGIGTVFMTLAGGTAGAGGGTPGGQGANGGGTQPASGGGGGGGSITITPAGAGGQGGSFGGGGGGGAGGLNTPTPNTGAGGNGGPAACIIIAW